LSLCFRELKVRGCVRDSGCVPGGYVRDSSYVRD
jgi:hypothetical protein